MLQTAHSRKGYYASRRGRLRIDYAGHGRILRQAQMTPVLMIIVNEFNHDPVKLPWVEHDNFVQQFTA